MSKSRREGKQHINLFTMNASTTLAGLFSFEGDVNKTIIKNIFSRNFDRIGNSFENGSNGEFVEKWVE